MNDTLHYDVFNGDADGICSLLQLRLVAPRAAELVTGVKRDIALLDRIGNCTGDLTVLDISFDNNHRALRRLLDTCGHVFYVDHHAAREAFTHPRLRFVHDESPALCTGLLVDLCLSGQQREWAIVAAFGDNLEHSAHKLAQDMKLPDAHVMALQTLGRLINYNAYGETLQDLHYPPADLYQCLLGYARPLAFVHEAAEFEKLRTGHDEDMAALQRVKPAYEDVHCAAFVLPDADWARRASGEFANRLVARGDGRSCAVITARRDGGYTVSVRAAHPERASAYALCKTFEGGGRLTAAGINQLPAASLEHFLSEFAEHFSAGSPA